MTNINRGLFALDTAQGIKAVPLSQASAAMFSGNGYGIGGADDSDHPTVAGSFATVPWLYRALLIRSQAITDMPWSVTLPGRAKDVTSADPKPVDRAPWLPKLSRLLGGAELDLVAHGEAYWFREANSVKTTSFRRLLPSTVTPLYDSSVGLAGWQRQLSGRADDYELSQIVYWWQPSLTVEVGPGVAPAQVALRAASVIRGADVFTERFLRMGGPLWLLAVDPRTQESDLKRLEAWWKQVVNGVKRAWESIALRSNVTPTQIGAMPKDVGVEVLTSRAQKDISVAVGIPYTLLFSEASNFATAQQDTLNLYTQTVLPECANLEQGLNEQVFYPLGMAFRFAPERLEVLEWAEAQKAYPYIAAWNSGLLKRSEWRQKMSLPWGPEDEVYSAPRANPQFGSDRKLEKQTAADAGASEASIDNGDPTGTQSKALGVDARDLAQLDMARWERKALKALKAGKSAEVEFLSDAIGYDDALAIASALQFATTAEEVRAAFSPPFRNPDSSGGTWDQSLYP